MDRVHQAETCTQLLDRVMVLQRVFYLAGGKGEGWGSWRGLRSSVSVIPFIEPKGVGDSPTMA